MKKKKRTVRLDDIRKEMYMDLYKVMLGEPSDIPTRYEEIFKNAPKLRRTIKK